MRAPTGKTLVALVLALCFLAGTIGWRIGQGFPPGRDDERVEFLYGMIAHHEQAVAMARIELLKGSDQRVKILAEEILRFQAYEIGLMERHLIEWRHSRYDAPDHTGMPGLASDAEMDGLLRSEDDTDAWFVALMVDHHAAGVAMANEVATGRGEGGVGGLAARMAIAQRSEIGELLRAADRGRLDVPPDGVTWDVYDADADLDAPADHHD